MTVREVHLTYLEANLSRCNFAVHLSKHHTANNLLLCGLVNHQIPRRCDIPIISNAVVAYTGLYLGFIDLPPHGSAFTYRQKFIDQD
jgi:hypothetical protein